MKITSRWKELDSRWDASHGEREIWRRRKTRTGARASQGIEHAAIERTDCREKSGNFGGKMDSGRKIGLDHKGFQNQTGRELKIR
jgi:hypothetical protein